MVLNLATGEIYPAHFQALADYLPDYSVLVLTEVN
jgi:hypothetical protein